MPSIRTKFSVGLFVIIGMTVVVIFVLWLGMAEFFQEGRNYVAYFDESVQGLNKDSAVKYRGVNIGRVDSISVAPDGRLIQIIFTANKKLQHSDEIVAQLETVGITGIMFVELERTGKGEKAPQQHFSFTPEYQVIATKPSEMKQFLSDLYDILSRIKQLDIKGISNRLNTALDSLNKAVVDANVPKLSSDIQKTLTSTNRLLNAQKWEKVRASLQTTVDSLNALIEKSNQTVTRVDSVFQQSGDRFNETVRSVKSAADNANQLFVNGTAMVQNSGERISVLDQHITAIIGNLETATRNLNLILAELRSQPSQLLLSAPAAPKPIEPERPGTAPVTK